jgi:hypothetical protein
MSIEHSFLYGLATILMPHFIEIRREKKESNEFVTSGGDAIISSDYEIQENYLLFAGSRVIIGSQLSK